MKEFLVFLAAPLVVVGLIVALVLHLQAGPPTVSDVTAAYAMPGPLAGASVYRLNPKDGLGPTLYVVAVPGEPVTTAWRTGGKNGHMIHTIAR